MQESPALRVLFAADECYSPAQVGRDLLLGEGETWPFHGAGAPHAMKEACALSWLLQVALESRGKWESDARHEGRAAASRAVGKHIPVLSCSKKLIPLAMGRGVSSRMLLGLEAEASVVLCCDQA